MRWTKLGRAAREFLYVFGQPFVARTPFRYARRMPPAVIDAATSFEYRSAPVSLRITQQLHQSFPVDADLSGNRLQLSVVNAGKAQIWAPSPVKVRVGKLARLLSQRRSEA
jgi:hypothetical protein